MQIKIVLFYDHVYRGRNNQVTVYAKLVKNWDYYYACSSS